MKDESAAGSGSGALAELRQENEFLMKERERLTKMLEELKTQEKGQGQTQAAPSAEAMQQLEELRRQLEEKELAAAESQRKLQNAELFEISEEVHLNPVLFASHVVCVGNAVAHEARSRRTFQEVVGGFGSGGYCSR